MAKKYNLGMDSEEFEETEIEERDLDYSAKELNHSESRWSIDHSRAKQDQNTLDKIHSDMQKIGQKLSFFDREFVKHYIKTGNAAEAARLAGSKAKNPNRVGWNTMAKPDVQKYLGYHFREVCLAAALDETEVVDKLRRTWDAAHGDGKHADANKAAELLGGYLGMFKHSNKTITNAVQVVNKEIEAVEEKALRSTRDAMLDIAEDVEFGEISSGHGLLSYDEIEVIPEDKDAD